MYVCFVFFLILTLQFSLDNRKRHQNRFFKCKFPELQRWTKHIICILSQIDSWPVVTKHLSRFQIMPTWCQTDNWIKSSWKRWTSPTPLSPSKETGGHGICWDLFTSGPGSLLTELPAGAIFLPHFFVLKCGVSWLQDHRGETIHKITDKLTLYWSRGYFYCNLDYLKYGWKMSYWAESPMHNQNGYLNSTC